MNISQISIREATPLDIDSIYELIQSAMTKYAIDSGIANNPDISLSSLSETPQDIFEYMKKSRMFLAAKREKKGEKIIGTIRIKTEYENQVSDKEIEVSRFAVHPDYQGIGLGGELLKFVEEHALKNGYKSLCLYTSLDNKPLLSFYISKGFTVVSQSVSRGYRRGFLRKELN